MCCWHSFEGRKEGRKEGKREGKEKGRRERRRKDEGKSSSLGFGGGVIEGGCHGGGAVGPWPRMWFEKVRCYQAYDRAWLSLRNGLARRSRAKEVPVDGMPLSWNETSPKVFFQNDMYDMWYIHIYMYIYIYIHKYTIFRTLCMIANMCSSFLVCLHGFGVFLLELWVGPCPIISH